MDTTSIKHLGNNDGYDLEMSVSFSLSFHFQNVGMGTIFYITYLKGHRRYNIFENNFEGTPPV